MKKIYLLVEDDYLETFMDSLPKEKVIAVEEDFEENQKLLQNILEEYKENQSSFLPYYESMKDVSNWLKMREN